MQRHFVYEYGPSLTRDGTLYFFRNTGSQVLLLRSGWEEGRYQEPQVCPVYPV